MSRATVELDFFGMEKENSSKSSPSQQFLQRRRSFCGLFRSRSEFVCGYLDFPNNFWHFPRFLQIFRVPFRRSIRSSSSLWLPLVLPTGLIPKLHFRCLVLLQIWCRASSRLYLFSVQFPGTESFTAILPFSDFFLLFCKIKVKCEIVCFLIFRTASEVLPAPETAPLTIFYNGTVSIFNIPRDKVRLKAFSLCFFYCKIFP